MEAESTVAFQNWKLHYKSDPRFKPIHAGFIGSDPVVLFYAEGDEYPWSVQYRGNGHYFKSESEADKYIQSVKRHL